MEAALIINTTCCLSKVTVLHVTYERRASYGDVCSDALQAPHKNPSHQNI